MLKYIASAVLMLLLSGCTNSTFNFNNIDEDIQEIKISSLEVEQNRKNVLSCRLSFKTDMETGITVKYYSAKHSGYEISGKKGLSHYFFLWGMYADSKYTIEIYSGKDLDTPIEVTEYVTGSLPDTVPYMNLVVNEKDKVFKGFVLFTYYAVPIYESKPIAMMVDTEGKVVWYFEYYMAGFNTIGDLQYIYETSTILISLMKGPNMVDIPAEEAIEIDLEGNIVWKAPEIRNVYSDENSWHHTYKVLDDDTIATLRYNYIDSLVTDFIVNLDRDYNVLWSWTFPDHFKIPECEEDLCDWTHANGVNMLKDDRVVYINSRNLSQYFKIDMDSGNVLWTFGKDGDFEMVSDHPDPWIEFAHAPEIDKINRNEVMFYDNGSEERGYSRIIKYRLNQEDMTAEIIFEFDGISIDKKWYTRYWGDSETVGNGNVFITAGAFEPSEETKFFEITPEGEMVWEMSFDPPEPPEFINTLYNSHKFVPELKSLRK